MSAVNFSVTSAITVTAPNTAVTWAAGSTRTITWNHSLGAAAMFDIDFSPNGGAAWSPIAAGVPAATGTTGTFTGLMPTGVTAQALVRVSPSGLSGSGDISNVVFTLAAPAVAVTSPNTAVAWIVGTHHNITWTHNLGTGESVRLELSRDGGVTWAPVAASVLNSGATSGTFDWLVDAPLTTTARVRVSWLKDGSVNSVSPVNFSITSAITVTTPNNALVVDGRHQENHHLESQPRGGRDLRHRLQPRQRRNVDAHRGGHSGGNSGNWNLHRADARSPDNARSGASEPGGRPLGWRYEQCDVHAGHTDNHGDGAEHERRLGDRFDPQHHVVPQPGHSRVREHRGEPERGSDVDFRGQQRCQHGCRDRNIRVDRYGADD